VPHVEVNPLDGGEIVPPAHCGTHGRIDACPCIGIAIRAHRVAQLPAWNGIKLDDLAIAHLLALGDGVCPHIIFGGRSKVLYPVDGTVMIDVFGGAIIVDGGRGVCGPAESSLHHICAGNGETTECHRAAACKALVGCHYGLFAGGVSPFEGIEGDRQFLAHGSHIGKRRLTVVIHTLRLCDDRLETVGRLSGHPGHTCVGGLDIGKQVHLLQVDVNLAHRCSPEQFDIVECHLGKIRTA